MLKSEKHSVSFIVPAYNCAETIEETIVSVFEGNFEDGDEIIVINDSSTDHTIEVIERIRVKYPAIQLLHHRINKGSAAASRNTGIEQAQNEILFCLDADNVLASRSIAKLKKYLLENKADAAAFGEIHYFKEQKKENVKFKWSLAREISLSIGLNEIEKNPLSSGNYMFTRESWIRAGRYNESVGGAWDSWAFGFCQLATGSKMITLPDTHYYHRYGYESTYFRDIKKANVSLTALRIIIPFLHLLDERDVEYIMSKKGRYTWVDTLKERPLRVKESSTNHLNTIITDVKHSKKPHLFKRIALAVLKEIKK
jgi:glycosyltransferase involved in cell wall biosynthesis